MLSTAIIVFREVLEAALIIGIACAATRSIPRRGWWVSAGIGVGVLLSCVLAAFAGAISGAADGVGQELLSAGILLFAVGMLGWHNVWMARHGREMAMEMKAIGHQVASGQKSIYALTMVILLAVLREGSEVVLFLYGIAQSGSSTAGGMLAGGAVGLAAGSLIGVVIYSGLMRLPIRHFFTVTSWMILLLAAGLASQAARYLIQADVLPAMGDQIWDTTGLLAGDSIMGRAMQTLVGYDPRPAGAQLLFYLVSLAVIGVSMKLFGSGPAAAPRKA